MASALNLLIIAVEEIAFIEGIVGRVRVIIVVVIAVIACFYEIYIPLRVAIKQVKYLAITTIIHCRKIAERFSHSAPCTRSNFTIDQT